MNDFKRVEQSTYNKMGKLQVKMLNKRNQKFFRLTKYNGRKADIIFCKYKYRCCKPLDSAKENKTNQENIS